MSLLIVSAVPAEAAVIRATTSYEVLVTGVGTVPAAIAVTRRLAVGPLPERVINVGTAGSLVDDHWGTFEIEAVTKHDFSAKEVPGISEHVYPKWLDLETSGKLPVTRLATGDTFVKDSQLRSSLSKEAHLVDMEGYAVVAAAQTFGVPVTLLKNVSDPADETAGGLWANALERAAHDLADALAVIV
ncbi:nucleosidase [Corynebacterium lubricantis]|uniref:nucleosidase n=1 Tax=Corynebacterium lubricantis TaxID=541095 RepID=UPI00037D5649|nr:nucleosidase [Corynebacterium lubricantis]